MYCTNCGTKNGEGSRFCAGCGAALGDNEGTMRPAGRPDRKKTKTTLIIGIAAIAVVLIAVILILLKPWAQNGGAAARQQAFLIKQSVALSQDVQKGFSALRGDIQDLGNVDFGKWKILDSLDLKDPGAAAILTVNADLVSRYLTVSMKKDKADISNDVIDYFTQKMPSVCNSYITSMLVVKQKLAASALGSMMFFTKTHIEKAPDNFENAVVFMGYPDFTTVSVFTQYDEYVTCSCTYTIPLPLDTVVSGFTEVMNEAIGADIASGYFEELGRSQLRDILAH